jgi:hypothetical protein
LFFFLSLYIAVILSCSVLFRFNLICAEVTTGKAYVAYRESIEAISDDARLAKHYRYEKTFGVKRMFAAGDFVVIPKDSNRTTEQKGKGDAEEPKIEENLIEISESAKKLLSAEEYSSLMDGFRDASSR